MLSIFKPASHTARLPAAEIDPTYRRLRWQIFLGIFFGYAAYYLVRKNFALAMPYLVEQGFSRGDLGFALSGISIAYGFSKFIMGSVSDRSNPRVFLPAGLILAAAVMLFMGFVPWATSKTKTGPLPNRGARKINIIFIISVVLPKCKVSPFCCGRCLQQRRKAPAAPAGWEPPSDR